ncbi:hypothetical protein [Streptomyces chartreusis]|uniref:hypothetical protein n=1 Tax=Streptomyces chartreusis TaxID=1969 RepID=UPI00381C7DE0
MGRRRRTGRWPSRRAAVVCGEGERAELERLRAEAGEKDKRIRGLEMERDVCKRFVALWVK